MHLVHGDAGTRLAGTAHLVSHKQEPQQVAPLLYSFGCLFCLLASYFVVAPLREDAAISLGTDSLPKLFASSLVGVLLLTPLTSVFLSRAGRDREASLRQFYAVLATILLGFYVLYYASTLQAQATSRNSALVQQQQPGESQQPGDRAASVKGGDPTLDAFQQAVRAAFYVFINVQNLIAISAAWARCADVFSAEAASRLFGFVSAGATIGQLVGSLVTATVAGVAKEGSGPVYGLIFVSALLMYAAAFFAAKVQRPGGRLRTEVSMPGVGQRATDNAPSGGSTTATAARGKESTGGGGGGGARSHAAALLEGFALIARSPYLLLMCGYLMMTYVVGSLMYFQRSLVVALAVSDTNARTAFFARVYSASALATIVLQMFATGRMLKGIGIAAALAIFPLACAGLIAYVGMAPTMSSVALGEVVRKLLGYALVRPAREVLFTVVSREEKYKAKLTIDAVVQRMGDCFAALVFEVLDVRLHFGQQGVAVAGVVACGIWGLWALRLGWRHAVLAVGTPGMGGAGADSSA
ncbi:hypothetical protein FOA52_015500 [Chlamydomonas sp. UWO 241]|nr:hypothetical protein FOA52_015500 [Chlamydomonas sp. UWO 241]